MTKLQFKAVHHCGTNGAWRSVGLTKPTGKNTLPRQFVGIGLAGNPSWRPWIIRLSGGLRAGRADRGDYADE
ncbi:MAG: hypothetical protein IT425_01995 [Pirellulales bacterium]|nr:hypothetical protein [Pirellulales bacterium]